MIGLLAPQDPLRLKKPVHKGKGKAKKIPNATENWELHKEFFYDEKGRLRKKRKKM